MNRGFGSVREAREKLRELEVLAADNDLAIEGLIAKFRQAYPSGPPARLVFAKNRGIVWRTKAASPNEQRFFVFTSDIATRVIERAPKIFMLAMLEYERERANLNYQFKCLRANIRNIKYWIKEEQARAAVATLLPGARN